MATPIELQVGWLVNRYGAEMIDFDFKLLVRSSRLAEIYRVFMKLGQSGGQKRMTTDEWKLVRGIILG